MRSRPSIFQAFSGIILAVALTACIPQGGQVVGDVDYDASKDQAPQMEPTPEPSASAPPPANVAPKANAGSDLTITLPTANANLTGSGTDTDGTIASYRWSKVSGPADPVFANANAASTAVSGLSVAGNYVLRLTVTDNQGATGTDDVQVRVNAQPEPNPTPTSVSVPVEEGLPPPAIKPCTLQAWQRNLPNKGFNNLDTVLYVPCDYGVDPNKKYPLVISNHGRGGSTLDTATHSQVGGKNFEGMIKQLRDNANLRATYGAIVLAPDLHAVGNGGDFAPNQLITNMEARLILDAIKHLRVDPKRVVVTGLSYGGALTNDMMIHYLPLLAGASPVSIQPPNKGNITPENTCRYVKFPLWPGGNKGDGVYNHYEWTKNIAGGFKYTLERCPGYEAGRYFQITGYEANAHSGWDKFYSDPAVLNWLMSQVQP